MSDLTASQALLAEIEKANPHLDSEEAAPAAAASPDLEGEEGDEGDEAGEEAGQESDEVTGEEGEQHAEEQRRPSRKERARIKLNTEIARRIKAEETAAQLQRERDQALAVKSQPPADEGIDETPKTKADFFFDDDKYSEYLADQKYKKRVAAEAQKSEETRVKQAEATFADKAGKFREEHQDFDDVALKTPLGPYYTPDVIEAIRDGDTGPQLAYYLGQNLAETEQLLKMAPTQRARAIGRIEAKLEAAPAQAAVAPAKPAAAQPPRTVTRAPAVGSTVAASAPAQKPLSELSVQDHIERLRVKRR